MNTAMSLFWFISAHELRHDSAPTPQASEKAQHEAQQKTKVEDHLRL